MPQFGTSEARVEAFAESERMFQAFVDRALAMWFGQMPTRVGGSERPTAPESIERPTAPDPDRRYRAEAATIPFQPEAPTRSFVSADRVRPVSRTATLESPSIRASAAPSEKTFPVPSEPAPEPQVPASPSGQKPRPPVVLLTQKKKTPDPERYASVVPLRGDDTLKTEAVAAVPEVASVLAPAPPPAERSEDGHAPAHELDRVMNEMKVLLDYGHRQQVRTKIQDFCRRYPEDLLLLRRVAEFYLENNDRSAAMETLFLLASRLFERRNVEGMRRALEQVLVLDPTNKRAFRLLGLLDERPSTGTGG